LNPEETLLFQCPHCMAEGSVLVDAAGGRRQTFVQDCEVCCRPLEVSLRIEDGEVTSLDVKPEN